MGTAGGLVLGSGCRLCAAMRARDLPAVLGPPVVAMDRGPWAVFADKGNSSRTKPSPGSAILALGAVAGTPILDGVAKGSPVRATAADVPVWELALAIVLLVVASYAATRMVSRFYRRRCCTLASR